MPSIKVDTVPPDVQAKPGIRRLIGSVLAPGHWFYILGLLIPVALVDLLCQTSRIVTADAGLQTTFGSLAYFDQIKSDLFYYLAVIVFWVVVFAGIRRRITRRIATVLFHVFFTLQALLVVLTQLYFVMLDIVLDDEAIALVPMLFQVEMVKIIQAEVKSVFPLLALAGIVLANFFSVIINRSRKPRWLHKPPVGHTQLLGRRAIQLGGAAVVLLLIALSALPDAQGTTAFTRNRVVSITMDSVAQAEKDPPKGFVAPTAADLPTQTRLVPTAETKKYNVVQIMLESQGWQATSLGNPDLQTTPELEKLARTSLVAERAYSAMPHTSKSLVASNCGVAPPLDTVNSEAEPGGLAAKCLPSLLNEQGYATAFFQTATENFENRDKLVDALGFQRFFPLEAFKKTGFSPTNTLGYEDDLMLQPSIDWAKAQTKPFALEYMTLTAHTQYVLPKGYPVKRYVEDEVHNNYLNAVRYQDEFLGKVIDGFKKAGLYDNTIFVVMGDHGEGFREHGRRLHNDTAWNEGLQVPLVIRAPDRWENGARFTERPVLNMSTLPTVVDLLGFRIEGGTYSADSVLDPPTTSRPTIASCWNVDQCLAYFDGDHKYIYFFDHRRPQYFDVVKDPLEKKDLFTTLSQERKHQLEQTVLLWQAEVNAQHKLSRALAQR